MISLNRWSLAFVALMLCSSSANAIPGVRFVDLMLHNEQHPRFGREAKLLADRLGLPRTLYFPQGVLVEALGMERGRPVYAVISNLAHPFEGGMVLFYEELAGMFNPAEATVNPSGPIVLDTRPANPRYRSSATGYLLVPEWTADKVMAFDPATGNLLDTAFIHSISTALASPKEARLSPRGTITVSDQITDLVQDFDTSGAYIAHFAPSGGVTTTILDNIRGHAYRPNGRLVVTVGSGANQSSVAEFDSAGNYLGQFIAAGAGGLNSPFCVLFRSNDILVSASSSPTGVHRYDLNGVSLSQWASITNFPQQVVQLANGNIAVANFSGTGQTGIRIYTSDGTFLRLLSGVTGNRGVYQLDNGNFLTTNAAGIHEIDSASGSLIRTIAVASNMQYIDLVNRTLVNVQEQEGLPTTTTLEQNYPNPFNPTTNIRFRIPTTVRVTITVFDMLGREVAALVNGTLQAGVHELTFDASELPTGVYVYRLQAGSVVDTKRLVLIK